jgi:hypothetical protein
MAAKVYLHIGAPKTGTTYLQKVLQSNREALEAQGIRYAPGRHHNDRVWATEVLRGFTADHRPRKALRAWDRIVRQVQEWEGTAVISHEFFGACDAEQAKRALDDLAPSEVHLVFTARDYLSQFTAVWQERLKYGFADAFSEFTLDNETPAWSWQTQDIAAILDRWRHDLPAKHVHVITVPPPGSPPGLLWQRFASVIGADSAGLDTGVPPANTSLGLVETALLRLIDQRVWPRMKRPHDRSRFVRDLLANKVLSQGSQERFTVTPEQADRLLERGKSAIVELEREGYDVVGSLEDLLPDIELLSSRTPDEASQAELLDAALDAIVGLLIEFKAQPWVRKPPVAPPPPPPPGWTPPHPDPPAPGSDATNGAADGEAGPVLKRVARTARRRLRRSE